MSTDRIPTPPIQYDEDTGVLSGPMGEYYGTLHGASRAFVERLCEVMNAAALADFEARR